MEQKPLTAERWRQIETIFHQAAAEDESGRNVTLARLCPSDPELRREVEAMLRACDRESFPAPPLKNEPAIDLAGRRVGNYRLERLLGEGGMGSVYLASRADGQFEQQAAVKLLAVYLRGEFFTERFRFERQALAHLNHPNVTRLLDSGVTPEGDPYLVMEYVDGEPIDAYCDRRRLAIPERIRLFLQVCLAVDYAHRHLIVHRDLKPGNIFVDREGLVKLLDFGTAKLLATADADVTRTRFRMMTPRYASPEQLRAEEVTQLADVYALGVVLYELLTGAWPFGNPTSAIAGLERAIRDVDPLPPGRAITRVSADARSTPAAKLARTLERDLSNIALKAIQPDPPRRYGSVAELADDLENYLEGKPVRARPQTLAYRARKFVRRNRVTVVALAVAAIGICAAGASVFLNRRAPAGPVSIAVLPFTDPNADTGSDQTGLYLRSGLIEEVAEALSRLKGLRVIAPASVAQFKGNNIDFREAGRRLNVAHVLEGRVDRQGDRVKIVARLERVVDGTLLWSETYEKRESDLTSVQSELAAGVARSLNVGAPAAARHVPKPEAHDYYMKARYELQQSTTESVTQAEADYRRAIDLDPEYVAPYVGLAAAKYDQMVARGSTYQTEAERRSAEQLIRKALDLDPDLPSAHAQLALLAMQYDWAWDRAEQELRLAVAGTPNATAEQDYAFLLIFRGRFAEAEPHIRRLQDLDPFSTATMGNVSNMWNLEGRFAEARDMARKLSVMYPQMLLPKSMIALTYIEEGRADLALQEIEEWKASFPPAAMFEAMAQARAGRREEALRLMRPFEEKYPNPGVAMQWFALVYAFLGDEPNTVKWLERSADRHEFQALNLAVHPFYAAVRNSPGFRALEKRMGLLR